MTSTFGNFAASDRASLVIVQNGICRMSWETTGTFSPRCLTASISRLSRAG